MLSILNCSVFIVKQNDASLKLTEFWGRAVCQNLVDNFEPEKEIKFCFSQLRKRYLRQKLNQLNLAIAEAEDKGDKVSLKKLTEEFDKLSKQINL